MYVVYEYPPGPQVNQTGADLMIGLEDFSGLIGGFLLQYVSCVHLSRESTPDLTWRDSGTGGDPLTFWHSRPHFPPFNTHTYHNGADPNHPVTQNYLIILF